MTLIGQAIPQTIEDAELNPFGIIATIFYTLAVFPGFALFILGFLLYRGLDDFFNLERFFIKHYGQREAVIIRRDGTRTNEEFTYHRFARSRGAAMMLLALAWIIIGGLPLYLDYLAWLRG